MTQEEKQLLLIDLSARLPYGVMIEGLEHPEVMTIKHLAIISAMPAEPYKPYLRPMQRMTEVERDIFDTMTRGYTIHQQTALFDWLNTHHFDYRGLIPTGLALEAPKDMYKNINNGVMNKEDKELLLKDLSARLVYMPKVKITYQQQGIKGTDEGNLSYDVIEKIVNDLRNGVITDMQIYLRSMSSITEKEISDLQKITSQFHFDTFDNSAYVGDTDDGFCSVEEMSNILNYLNSHHFDYSGLIEKGLAIKVTKENNPYKE